MRDGNQESFISVLSLAVVIVGSVVSQSWAVSITELRRAMAAGRDAVVCGRVIYTKQDDSYDSRPSKDVDSTTSKFRETHNHINSRMDVLVDCNSRNVKVEEVDLRDIDALLKEYALSADEKINVLRTTIRLIRNTYDLEFIDIDVTGDVPRLNLFELPEEPEHLFELLHLGLAGEKLLADEMNPVLSKVEYEGKSMLCVRLARGYLEGVVYCEPAIGYRMRRIEWRSGGQLVREAEMDDYRPVNGLYYPFRYEQRVFDADGKVVRKTKYSAHSVDFAPETSADDFKISVPAGTLFFDSVLSMTTHSIDRAADLGIDDVLAIGAAGIED